MYTETTRSISVSVEPFYLAAQSEPRQERWMFGYRVTIENHGGAPVQLLSRHWRITDAHGKCIEVKGEGVVGEKPRLDPGERFEYTSGAPLATPSGFMVGTYQMVSDDGESFEVRIPAFSLDAPGVPRALN